MRQASSCSASASLRRNEHPSSTADAVVALACAQPPGMMSVSPGGGRRVLSEWWLLGEQATLLWHEARVAYCIGSLVLTTKRYFRQPASPSPAPPRPAHLAPSPGAARPRSGRAGRRLHSAPRQPRPHRWPGCEAWAAQAPARAAPTGSAARLRRVGGLGGRSAGWEARGWQRAGGS